MESWRELAIELFPEFRSLYEQAGETIGSVLSDQLSGLIEAHRNSDLTRLANIYGFAEWCYSQKDMQPELWRVSVPAFFEHLVDQEETFLAIPKRVKPKIFEELLPVFKHRLVDLPRDYGISQPGSYHGLLALYDQENGTDFARQHSE